MFRCSTNRIPWGRLVRFGVVGFSGFCVDFGTTALLNEVFGVWFYLATGVGFCLGATSNYILNRKWTWRSDNPDVAGEFAKFFGVSLIGLGIHYVVFWGCTQVGWLVLGGVVDNYWTSKLVATAVVMVWNFLANNYYTFKKA